MVCKLVIESEKNKDILKKMNEKIEENKMNIDIKICPKCFSQMKKTETDDPEKFLKNYISNDSVETIKHYLKNNNNTYPYYKCKNKECNNVLVDSSIL